MMRKPMGENTQKIGHSHGKAELDLYLAYNLHKITSTWLRPNYETQNFKAY